MLTAEQVNGYLERLPGNTPHDAARKALVAEIREQYETALAAGDIPEGTPMAATFTVAELAERGIAPSVGKDGKTRGSGLKASRKGNGPIAKVGSLDSDTVLVVLNSAWIAEHGDGDEDAEQESEQE